MSESLFAAEPLSQRAIEAVALNFRNFTGKEDPFLDVCDLLEVVLPIIEDGFVFEIRTRDEMGDRHGFTDVLRPSLALREDVYIGLCENRPRDRFTAAHEIGHLLLHTGRLNRRDHRQQLKTFCDPEWQANAFAGSLLMPEGMVQSMRSVSEMQTEFGVSVPAAETRLRVLRLQLPQNEKGGSSLESPFF